MSKLIFSIPISSWWSTVLANTRFHHSCHLCDFLHNDEILQQIGLWKKVRGVLESSRPAEQLCSSTGSTIGTFKMVKIAKNEKMPKKSSLFQSYLRWKFFIRRLNQNTTTPLASLIPGAILSVEKSKIDASSGDLWWFEYHVYFFCFFKVKLRSINGFGGWSLQKQSCCICPEVFKNGLTCFLRSFFTTLIETMGLEPKKFGNNLTLLNYYVWGV